jgi:hypothetical protein
MENIYWAWADGDGVYINKAESFTEIILEVIEYYMDDYDKVDSLVEEHMIKIHITQDSKQQEFCIKSNDHDVSNFLDEISAKFYREDMFCIRSDF